MPRRRVDAAARSPSPGERRLFLRDFAFHGFEGLRRPLRRHLRTIEVRGETPTAETVADALFVPAAATGRKRRQREALVEEFAAPTASAAGAARELAAEVVYLGWLFDHYGHFLMQSLARAWYLAEADPAVKVVFHRPAAARWAPPGWTPRILAAFGIPPERVLVLDAPTRIRRLVVPEPLFASRSVAGDRTVRVHEAMAGPYRAVAEQLVDGTAPSAQPLYLSRRRLPSSQRRIVGEAELEEVLRHNGFRIAYPETMTFEEQVRLVNAHTDIVSNAGSAAHNALFALHGPRLHLMTHETRFSPDYFLYAPVVGAPTTFVNCLGTGGRPSFDGAQKQTPHLVDAATLLDHLFEAGLIAKRPPAPSAGRTEERQAHYDEAWLYGRVRTTDRDEPLGDLFEREAAALAPWSWPVGAALACYYAVRDDPRADGMARQFAAGAAAEPDPNRLAHYRAEIAAMAPAIAKRCDGETAERFAAVVVDRFGGDPELLGRPR